MEMKRDSAACEPGKRPIDLVTSTATSELLAMASLRRWIGQPGDFRHDSSRQSGEARYSMPARKRPPGGDKQCEGERGIISATIWADGAGGENRRRGNESMLFFPGRLARKQKDWSFNLQSKRVHRSAAQGTEYGAV